MGKRYFHKELGFNADIERHREEEQKLRMEIENARDEKHRRVYTHFLNQLLESKTTLVSKIGKRPKGERQT